MLIQEPCFDRFLYVFSQFDRLLRSKWDHAMEQGYFRYDLSNSRSKIVPGKYRFVLHVSTLIVHSRIVYLCTQMIDVNALTCQSLSLIIYMLTYMMQVYYCSIYQCILQYQVVCPQNHTHKQYHISIGQISFAQTHKSILIYNGVS